MIVCIVPNSLRDQINEAIDCTLIECPGAECVRDELYKQLLEYFDEHGVIPEFKIQRKNEHE